MRSLVMCMNRVAWDKFLAKPTFAPKLSAS